ncbi:MAG TPA: hypothetical protein VFV63_17330 [Ilumatobacteraceae bacterium]|nr:hypothetical protein [Ilumatobacteraceae bacterium]
MSRWRPAVSAIVVAVLAGCGGGGNGGDEQVESTATAASTTPAAGTTEPVDTAATTEPTEPATTEVATSAPTTTIAEGVIPGTAAIALLTDGTGLGARPLLRWEAAEGAVSYVVSVNTPSGGPMWAWEGSVTEVSFGGGPADDLDTTGAQLVGPATWFVAALDADGVVIASSAPADLAP